MDQADGMVFEGLPALILNLAETIYDIVRRRRILGGHFSRFYFDLYGGVTVLE